MYRAIDDPYCYRGSSVLKNILGIRDQAALTAFETISTTQRADEPLPNGLLSVRHYCAIHRHLFQDVYRWAGRFRTVRISKDGSMFCYPENIPAQMRRLFESLRRQRYLNGLSRTQFSMRAAHVMAELNAIHPFRDGNGRSQLTLVMLIAERAGHPIDLDRLKPERFLAAMIRSFDESEVPLRRQLLRLVRR